MKRILLLCLLFPFIANAQDDPKYLQGAVPVVDGKVVFSEELDLPLLSKDQVFDALLKWANEQFSDEDNRVVFTNKESGQIAVMGKRYLVFSNTALSLDRSMMSYRVLIECSDKKAVLKIHGIRYEYGAANKKEPDRYTAEEWITDEHALRKNKLIRGNGKFRKKTIDFAGEMFESAKQALGLQMITEGKVITTLPVIPIESSATIATEAAKVVEATKIVPAEKAVEPGFMVLDAAKIPATLVEMLPSGTLKIVVGDKAVSDKVTWKGLGNMFGKTIATIAVPGGGPAYKAISGNPVYKLSFYKEEGDESPWLIMECNKQGETAEGAQKTIIGEVLRVMIK